MKNHLVHEMSTKDAQRLSEIVFHENVRNSQELSNKLADNFDLGDEVEAYVGFDVYRYIEELADYDTLFIPKGTIGIIESSGWNMSNEFKTTFDITLMVDGNEVEYCVKEEDISNYFKKR